MYGEEKFDISTKKLQEIRILTLRKNGALIGIEVL